MSTPEESLLRACIALRYAGMPSSSTLATWYVLRNISLLGGAGSECSLSRQYGQLSASSNHLRMQWLPKTCLHFGKRRGCSLMPSGLATPKSL